jgi:fermentation-respiration switch protein FrsA (DUF1100 family)
MAAVSEIAAPRSAAEAMTADEARSSAVTRREAALVALASGLIAVHVLDDSFIQPQPGTSAADHLAGGLVPVALLGLGVVLFLRARAGIRAVVALLLGFFGLVTAVEAVYYSAKVGASGDDYTGFLGVPAGVLLIGIGVWTLWRTRKRQDSLRRRSLRGLLYVLGVVLVSVFVLYAVAESYVVTHVARAVVPPAKLGAHHEEVQFTTEDGLRLHGWYVPSENGATVIAFPGRSGPQRQTRMLVRHGYGVLLFDRRGEGESDGDPNTLGWAGVKDLRAAIEFLRARDEVDPNRIGGIGLSVGGELLLQAAAESDALKAVVSEGAGIRSVREALESPAAESVFAVPVWTVTTAATTIFSNTAPPPNLRDLVARIAPRSVFFIYAEKGAGGEQLSADYYEAAGEPKSLWETEGGHTGGIETHPDEYEQRVVSFFDRALLSQK